MAEFTTNTLRAEDKSCSQTLIWIVDPFGCILKQLKDGECHLLRSPVIHTWWDDDWLVKLVFFREETDTFTVKTAIINLKRNECEESFSWKGDYHFQIFIFSKDENEVIHEGSRLSSEYSCSKWVNLETLKVRVEVKCSLFRNIPRFKPIPFNFYDRLTAVKDMEELFDFTIEVGNQEIKTNKTILALASPVFMAMFCGNFQEKHRQRVCMNDVSVDTVRKFLDFIYGGKISSVRDLKSAIDLVYMAEKYDVVDLKKTCLEFIHSTFSNEAMSE